MSESEEPAGLYMSLDDIIAENKEKGGGQRGRGGRGGQRGGGGGRSGQQGRFDGGAARREAYIAQRGRGRGQGQYSERSGPGFVEVAQTCFVCGEPGHIARECPNSQGASGGGGSAVGPCYNCGQMGHVQRDCPGAPNMGRSGGGGRGRGRAGSQMGGGGRGSSGQMGGGPMVGGFGVGPQAAMGMAGPMGMGQGMGMGAAGMVSPELQLLQMEKMMLLQRQQELAMLEQQQLAMAQQQEQRQQRQVQQQPGPQRRQQQGQGQEDAYRKDQSCFMEEPSGHVVVRFKATDIVRVAPNGDITLNTDGWYTPSTLASMNDALNVIGIRITAPGGDIRGGDWSITDGKALMRYYDGVVLPTKGPQHATRGRQLLQAFQNPNRQAAAAATAASNAAAAQAGIVPSMGYDGRGRGRSGGVFNRLGARGGGGSNGGQPGYERMVVDEDDGGRARRLRAQGRYNPY